MNSLEIIEKVIKNLKKRLKNIDKQIQENQNYLALLEFNIEEKKNLKKELTHFRKIKSELIAWEICKNDPVILDTIKTLAEGKSINWHRLSEKQRKSIKKVLEVEENERV